MAKLNRFIAAGLEEGKLPDLLLGKGEWRLPDYTDPSKHDIMLVMFVFLEWANQSPDPMRALTSFEAVLHESAVSDPSTCADVLLAYLITSRDRQIGFPIKLQSIMEKLRASLRDRESVHRSLISFLPELEKRVAELQADGNGLSGT